jgi:UDP-glucose 4-epimerase
VKLLVTGGAGYIGSVVAHQLVEAGVPRLVYSSTAVYSELEQVPIAETGPTLPTCPYGASKLAVDRMIRAALGWKPELEAMISDAWDWMHSHPNGYE